MLATEWLTKWWINQLRLVKGVSSYSEPALGHLSANCQGETSVTQNEKSVSVLHGHRASHVQWA